MSRNTTPLLLPLLALSLGCAGEVATGPDAGSALLDNQSAPITRPAGGSCTTTVTVVTTEPPLTLAIEGVCQLQHLGRTTMVTEERVDLTTGLATNDTRYTAANGDVLLTRFEGHITAANGPDVAFEGTETYLGGTGRFSDATGVSALVGSAVLPGLTGTGAYTTTGTISF